MKTLALVLSLLALSASPVWAQGEYLARGQWGLAASAGFAGADGFSGPAATVAIAPTDRLALRVGFARLSNGTRTDPRNSVFSAGFSAFTVKQEPGRPFNVEALLGYERVAVYERESDGRREWHEYEGSVSALSLGAAVSRDLDARPRYFAIPRVGVTYVPFAFGEDGLTGEPAFVGSLGFSFGFPTTARSALVLMPEVGLGPNGVAFAVGLGLVRAGGAIR